MALLKAIKRDLMSDEYDFSTAERGKFFREGACLVPPIHLDPDVLDYFAKRAEAQGMSLSGLANILLRKQMTRSAAGTDSTAIRP